MTTPGWQRAGLEADLVLDLPGGLPMHFRRVPAGIYRVGARGDLNFLYPRMQVEVQEDVLLGTSPTTQSQFSSCPRRSGFGQYYSDLGSWSNFIDLTPATMLSRSAANKFCAWLTNVGVLPANTIASLPHEWLWEIACRAGSETDYSNGDGEAALEKIGWYEANSGDRIHRVGEKCANGWGFHGLHGNVWEWCLNEALEGETRSQYPASEILDGWGVGQETVASERWTDPVLRGGSWRFPALAAASASRRPVSDTSNSADFGFRVCLSTRPDPERKARGARNLGLRTSAASARLDQEIGQN